MSVTGKRLLDVYAVLRAEPSASWSELRHSYRVRARELHPDVQAHRPSPHRLDQSRATALFTQLQQAWSLVATPELRAAYDLRRRGLPAASERAPAPPPLAPRWSAGPKAGVLLRTGPGDLHIALPGGSWDLSLAQFLSRCHALRRQPLLIGDLPPHTALRAALHAADFVERHRLTTMVGLSEPLEERYGDPELDGDGAWKVEQLGRAFARWARAQPQRRDQLPYAPDLRLMGRLSLAGYEINLPHPGGLHSAIEPRPADRAEARRRNPQPVLELRLPPLPLLLVAAWAGDRQAQAALGRGWAGLAAWAELDDASALAAQRALDGRRPRRDGHEPLSGSALDASPPPIALEPLLRSLPSSRAWLDESLGGPLPELPWREPLSQSGEDRSLSDAAARLLGRTVDRLLTYLPAGVTLVALRGERIRFRVESKPDPAAAWLEAAVPEALSDLLGFPAAPAVSSV